MVFPKPGANEANGSRDKRDDNDDEEEEASSTTSSTKQQESHTPPPPSPPPSVSSEDERQTDTKASVTAASTPQVARSSSMISTSNRNLPARSGKKHSPAGGPAETSSSLVSTATTTTTTTSVPRKPVAPTAGNRYPKKPPYIDAVNAQAVIPAGPFVKTQLPPSQDHPELRMVCNGQTNGEVFAYLNFCRRLTGSSEFPADRVPLEEDEEALEFLHTQANGNLDQAKLLLIASLSSFTAANAMTKPWELTASVVAPPLQDWLDESRLVLEHGGADCNQLLSLVRQGKALPADKPAVGPVLSQLECKVQECEQYLAKVHGALSAYTSGGAKRTITELRRLCTTQAPKRIVLHEVRVLQDIVLQCEQWEDAAERWLYAKSNRTYAGLAKLIQDGKRSVADHATLLRELEIVQSKYETTMHKLHVCVPPVSDPPKNWKTRSGTKHGFELAKLEILRELQVSLQELKLPRHAALDAYVNAAEEWIAQADPKSALSVKALQQQLVKAEFIPVDLTQERQTVEQFVDRANDFLKRSKAYFSSNAPPVLPVGMSMAAKKLAKQQAEAEALSRDSASFLKLKPELESLGLAQYADTEMLRDVIEVVRSWTQRVARALQTQDFEEMTKLAEEQASIPVPVQPEERMLQQDLQKLQWSKSARELLDATNPATPLTVFEAKLEEIDHIFDTTSSSSSGKKSVKRVKQRDMTASGHKLEFEDEVIARVDLYKKWMETCEMIVEHDTIEYDAYERCIAKIGEWGHLLGSRRALLDKAVQQVEEAQQHARGLFSQLLHSTRTAQLPQTTTSWSETYSALPISDFKQLVSKHQALGVQTPEFKLLEDINGEFDQWQGKFAEALRPVRKVKRNELPYRMATEEDILALLHETKDFPAIVDLSQQEEEIKQCLAATEEFRNLFSVNNKLDVDSCLRLFPYVQGDDVVASQQVDDQRVLLRLGIMRKDNDFPEEILARPRAFQPKQAQSDALLKMMRMMKDAEQRDLPVTGVNDTRSIRLVAWLIKAYMYVQRCDAYLDNANNNTALTLCKFVLDGTKLLTRVDYVGESLTPTMLDQLLPTTTITAAAKKDATTAPLDVYVDDDFAMLRHIRPLHVLDEEDAWAANAFVVEISKRLEFLRNGLQSHFATKFLCKHVIMRLPNRKRTANVLRGMLAKCPTTKRFNLDCVEETKLRTELAASEAWTQDFETKKFPLETVERIAVRGEKLWVDYSQIETLRARGKLAQQWTERVKQGLDDANSVLTIDQLRALLNEGLDLLSVDVTPQIEKLRHAVDLVCMCRAPREDKVEMMQCEDCHRDFHRECISQHFAKLCPFCFVFREVDRIVARAYAAICRVSVLDKDTAAIATGVTADAKTQMLLEFCRDRQTVLENLTANTQLPAPCQLVEIKDCIEVKAVDQALEVKKWSLQLDKRRNRPTLEDLETLIRGYPKPLKSACLVGLVHICNRGKMVLDNASQIWNLPLTTPSSVVMDRCQDAIAANKYLPLDMSQMNRALEACFNDNGLRHCLCRRFDDGGMMLSCVKCELWFHAQCVGVHKTVDEMSSVDFICPTCEVQARLQE